MKVEKLSPSELNTFKRCPRKWYHREVEHPQIKTDTKYLDFGAIIHESIDLYYSRIDSYPTDDEIKDVFYDAIDDNYGKVLKRLRYRYGKCRKHFVEFERERKEEWDAYPPTFTERRIKTKHIVGVIDFYSEPEKTIIDWKTGNYSEGNKIKRQGGIYKMLAKAEGYPVERILFVFLKDGKVFELPKIRIGWIQNEIRDMLDKVKHERFPKTDNKYDCNNCEWNLCCKLSDKDFWGEWW